MDVGEVSLMNYKKARSLDWLSRLHRLHFLGPNLDN